jgi:sec-independent protein translocase protein TatC
MREYLGFSAKLLFAFGVVFEMPLFITFLAKLGIVDVKFLRTKRRYAILLFFVFSAILTPPDVITQIMMAGPLILLYEVSILGAKIFGKKAAKEDISETQESAG